MKSDVEICQDVFALVVNSDIKTLIGGEVRYVPRRKMSKAEDCIISVLDGDCAQIQDSIVNVNVYVPNIGNGGESVENIPRVGLVAATCSRVFGEGKRSVFGDGFRIHLEKQHVLPVEGKDEYVINNRIRYKFNNE